MELTERSQRLRAVCLSVAVCVLLAAMHVPKFLGPEPDLAENRVLAEFPVWPTDIAGWVALPKAVDTYVQDRFPARGRLIAWLNALRYRIGDSGSARVIVGKRGWLFYDDGSHFGAARASVPLSDIEAARWMQTLSARTQRLADAGVPYFVLVPPLKERVYPEYAPDWFVDGGPATDAIRLQRVAGDAGYENVVYLLSAVLRAKYETPPAYSRFDTHWSGFGAYRAYVALADLLRGTKAEIEVWPIDRYRQLPMQAHAGPRDLGLMLGIAGFVRQEYPQHEYAEIGREPTTTYLTERHDWTGDRVIDTGRAGPVLMMTVDSFSNELLPFLYPHVSRLIVAHNQEGYFREDLIAQYKPDAVITEVLESGVRHSMNPAMDTAVRTPQSDAPAATRNTLSLETKEEVRDRAGDRSGGVCNLEIATHADIDSKRIGLRLEGWMFDEANGRFAASTMIVIAADTDAEGQRATVANDVTREDVAVHFGKPAARHSGFAATLALARDSAAAKHILAGEKLRFLMRQRYGADVIVCVTERTVDKTST